jgi:hypothetical protein
MFFILTNDNTDISSSCARVQRCVVLPTNPVASRHLDPADY